MSRVLSRRALFAAVGGSAAALVPFRAAGAQTPPPGRLVVHRTPVRVADTRTDSFPGRKLVAGDDAAFAVGAGLGTEGFASAVFVNVTITETEGAGFLAVRGDDSSGEEPPVVHSNINWFENGVTLANLVLSTVGAENSIAIRVGGNGRTHVILDVFGYVPFEVTAL